MFADLVNGDFSYTSIISSVSEKQSQGAMALSGFNYIMTYSGS